MSRICRFYMQGHCKKGKDCDFLHDPNLSKDEYFLNNRSTRPNNHKRNNKRRPRKKNTETFEPSHKSTDMKIIIESGKANIYPRTPLSNEVIFVPDLFCNHDDLSIYNTLLEEIKQSGVKSEDLWKLWHGDTHMIADDHTPWKSKCPTFNMIINKIRDYFKMDIKATRFNWYRSTDEWKPFHHDAAAVKPDKAKKQNFTVAVSFGKEREAAFEHAKTRTTVSMSLPNGSVYIFCKDVNIEWRHGILQVPPEKREEKGRISIIAWGKVDMIDI